MSGWEWEWRRRVTHANNDALMDQLKVINGKLDRMDGGMESLATELRVMSETTSGLQVLRNHDQKAFADLKSRVDKIEQRLDGLEQH